MCVTNVLYVNPPLTPAAGVKDLKIWLVNGSKFSPGFKTEKKKKKRKKKEKRCF